MWQKVRPPPGESQQFSQLHIYSLMRPQQREHGAFRGLIRLGSSRVCRPKRGL